ncbi:hypothetical protein [Pectinatus frisingensis]|uniref:hypothetical protein n=1 Tax=Pectinatus frisingensis TaxID=865 RepID=UPI0018C834BA|nr:hypothetical protein [Pectinatus frisingensis]
MKKYNDYIQTVIRYLSRNDELRTYLKNIEADKSAKEEMLKTIMHPITAQYSFTAGCQQSGNSSKVEQETERREKLQHEIVELNLNITEIRTNLDRVDRAMQQLDTESQIILKGRWIERDSWEFIASQIHSGIKRCRIKHDEALQSMATAVFGPKAVPEQLSFVFFK